MDELFVKLKTRRKEMKKDKEGVCDYLAYAMAELNVIHPFREGNGRTIREFIREYALFFGYTIDWSKVIKTELLDGMIESVFDTKDLRDCLNRCMR